MGMGLNRQMEADDARDEPGTTEQACQLDSDAPLCAYKSYIVVDLKAKITAEQPNLFKIGCFKTGSRTESRTCTKLGGI